jgi:F-type H+-transporting ATPase subunit epsilon
VISSGFYDVKDDVVNVLAETVELAGEIDLDRARRAQKAAEDNLKSAELTESSFRKYQLKLERALIRQQTAGR